MEIAVIMSALSVFGIVSCVLVFVCWMWLIFSMSRRSKVFEGMIKDTNEMHEDFVEMHEDCLEMRRDLKDIRRHLEAAKQR